MSYFCAKAISIDKQSKTCKVRGGDNNVVPRSDRWSSEFSLDTLLVDLCGGTIKFTANTDKHAALMAKADATNCELTRRFGLGAYDLQSLVSGSLNIAGLEEAKAYYLTPGRWSNGYGTAQATKIDAKISLYGDTQKMAELRKIIAEFCDGVANLTVQNPVYVIRRNSDGMYVARINKNSLSLTWWRERASRMTKEKAERSLGGFAGYQIVAN